ncbi:hypothetical protein [Actinomadura xylanilytica]|uniref:hypothetical protein n=1 Tax=Actinomadura xylanilytica TaxID=887459 RepID=UPI00255B1BDB|nr:hypothetical protein [Actinomadura xylanilytica]MDL4771991.1 hypothetical protein [Actinomadura xylanilytica]
MSTPATSTIDDAEPCTLPTLTEGAELVGEFKGSGYREPPQLVSLPNRQLVRLPPLLFQVVKALHDHRHLAGTIDPRIALDAVATEVSRAAGARISGEQVLFLVDRKLAPLGVTTYSNGARPQLVKPDTFLGLRFKLAVFPESATWILAGLFSWLFTPVAMIFAFAAVFLSEVWVLGTQSVGDALHRAILAPESILMVLGLAIASCVFHEIGHAAACRYSGVRPGVMGCGIYLVWPAFYTDITESYRLGRGGRIRTDLGGVYFNGIFLVGLTLVYLQTGFQPLLLVILTVNFEIIQQLLPTLRFDGYYIISDLVGIPDLFKYIKPILRRTLLRRAADERLKALKRWPQMIVTLWVLTVIPALAFQLTLIAVRVPELVVSDWRMIEGLGRAAAAGAGPLQLITAGLQILLLILPLLGLALLAYRLVRWLVVKAVRYVQGPAPEPALPGA